MVNNRCSDKTEMLAMLNFSMQKCTNFRSTAYKLGGKLMSIDFCCHSKVTCVFFSPQSWRAALFLLARLSSKV